MGKASYYQCKLCKPYRLSKRLQSFKPQWSMYIQ